MSLAKFEQPGSGEGAGRALFFYLDLFWFRGGEYLERNGVRVIHGWSRDYKFTAFISTSFHRSFAIFLSSNSWILDAQRTEGGWGVIVKIAGARDVERRPLSPKVVSKPLHRR